MKIYEFPFKNSSYSQKLSQGLYKFEAWGACGSPGYSPGGRGGYTSGFIRFDKEITVYVGELGSINIENFNGNKAGTNCNNGGGATDFRLEKGDTWYDFKSLKSRIMVAAGGGGSDHYQGGDAGGLLGISGQPSPNTVISAGVGIQTNGGIAGQTYSSHLSAYPGKFGIGGSGTTIGDSDGGSGGGNGYYGGGGISIWGGGAGGSSFVSGYPGCNAIKEESNQELEITHSNQPIHYSGLYFESPTIIAGNEEMPSPLKSTTMIIGNEGNGYARITVIDFYFPQRECFSFDLSLVFLFIYSNKSTNNSS